MKYLKTWILISLFFLLLHTDCSAYVTTDDLQSRVVRLETKYQLKFDEMEKALVLARELSEKDRTTAFSAMNLRLESMNEFRAQINRAEATYATKDMLNSRLGEIERLVYIGVGLVLALQFLMVFYSRRNNLERKQ